MKEEQLMTESNLPNDKNHKIPTFRRKEAQHRRNYIWISIGHAIGFMSLSYIYITDHRTFRPYYTAIAYYVLLILIFSYYFQRIMTLMSKRHRYEYERLRF